MSRTLDRLLLLLVLLGISLPAQGPWKWCDDPETACRRAKPKGKLVVLLFTVGERCPSCRSLEKDFFSESAESSPLAPAFEGARLIYGASAGRNPKLELWAMRADLAGYPTLYVVDGEGWPCLMQAGYDEANRTGFEKALTGVRKAAAEVTRLRKGGRRGLKRLLRWYEKRGMPLGAWKASRELFRGAAGADRAALVPRLIAATISEKGLAAAESQLRLLEKYDPRSKKGWHAPALFRAGNLLLRRQQLKEACSIFERLVALEQVPEMMRVESELGLGMGYRKLDDPDRARKHYERARTLALALGCKMGRAIARQAALRLEQLSKPGCDGDHDRRPRN